MHLRWLGLSLFVPAIVIACVGDSAIVGNPPDSSVANDARVESGADVAALPDAGGSPATLDAANQLALWLDGANVSLSNGKVGTWPDQSKNKNNASNAQASAPSQILAVADKPDAVHFVADNALTIKDSFSLQFGKGQFYMATVVKVASTPAYFTGPFDISRVDVAMSS